MKRLAKDNINTGEEYDRIYLLLRLHGELSEENKRKRIQEVKQAYHPWPPRLLARKARNVANTCKDSIFELLGLAMTRAKTSNPALATVASQQQSVKRVKKVGAKVEVERKFVEESKFSFLRTAFTIATLPAILARLILGAIFAASSKTLKGKINLVKAENHYMANNAAAEKCAALAYKHLRTQASGALYVNIMHKLGKANEAKEVVKELDFKVYSAGEVQAQSGGGIDIWFIVVVLAVLIFAGRWIYRKYIKKK